MTIDMDKELKRRARLISETELQAAIIDYVHNLGGVVAHFRPAKTAHGWRTAVAADGKGFPDLVICVNGRTLFRELKRTGIKLLDEQEAWGVNLTANGADWGVWRPIDWLDGTVEKELAPRPVIHMDVIEQCGNGCCLDRPASRGILR